jgi:putative ABC transport system substrate-binding protein
VAAFRQGLGESGFVEGRNIAIAWTWAYGQYGRLPALAANLVRQKPTLVVASGGDDAVRAARAATRDIPIVAMFGADPVEAGLVASINRPGGNVTGVTQFSITLTAKRAALLHELLPGVETIAVLSNPTSPTASGQTREIERAARALGVRSHIVTATTEGDFEGAFATMVRERSAGLVVLADPFFTINRAAIVALAARHVLRRLTGIHYDARDFVGATVKPLQTHWRAVEALAAELIEDRERVEKLVARIVPISYGMK